MKRQILICFMMVLIVLGSSCQRTQQDMGPRMLFSIEDAQTKAFINDVNRSGNQIVIFDYMKVPNYNDKAADRYEWYIDHERLFCEVDGQQVWDFVDGGEYYWLDRSEHNCFGWLFVGPSGYNTMSFFYPDGTGHPDIVEGEEGGKKTIKLQLPEYQFTLDSPIYDFLYSDVEQRSFSRTSPDTSPVALQMKHLFTAFKFVVKNASSKNITIKDVTLNVITKKSATIDFSKACGTKSEVTVTYRSQQAQANKPMKKENLNLFLPNDFSERNLFDSTDPDGYRLTWPLLDGTDVTNMVIKYLEDEQEKTKAIDLTSVSNRWEPGKRYLFNIVFTDKEISLDCSVKEWDYVENKLNFSDVVVVSDKIQWKESSVVSVDEHEGIVVLKESASNGADSEPAICYFKIVAPEGDNVTWQASLIGDSDAFEFVEFNSHSGKYHAIHPGPPSGKIGELAELMIRVKKNVGHTDKQTAKLRITVKVGEETILVENLCSGHDFHEYTIVRNPK